MFAEALKIVSKFTKPVAISHRKYNGECFAGIGTYVVINSDGWCVTAFHILKQFNDIVNAKKQFDDLSQRRLAIENDSSLSNGQKRAKLGTLKISNDAITNVSIWLGDGVSIQESHVIEGVDLAVFKLTNFDPNTIQTYPSFKDPTTPMDTGRSLCKLGFPLTTLKATFDSATQKFKLESASNSLALFPLEGIFTREVIIQLPGNVQTQNYKLAFLETSSPGLRGQSGGPTFDVNGTIWAIQSQTMTWPLEFGQNASNMSPKALEHCRHQFLNVGWGIHAATLIGFFNQNNISYNLAS